MAKAFAIAAVAALGLTVVPKTFQVDNAHSNVSFKVRHLGISSVTGSFQDYTAHVTVNPDDLSTLQAEAIIAVASIDTGNERRDGHLKSDDFFSAETYPEIRFVSKEVRNVNGNMLELVGDLTIRDITNEVVLETEYLGSATMRGAQVVAFEAQGVINRFDYDLQWNALTEAGGLMVGEDVRLILELEAAAQ